MNFGRLIPELDFALDFARRAAAVSHEVESSIKPITKSDRSPVTTADFAIQALAGRLIRAHFPGDVLVAEESSPVLREGHAAASLEEVTRILSHLFPDATAQAVCEWIDYGTAAPGRRFWTLDPIDGTKGFIRGHQYATALALVVDGRVELGILSCPRLSVESGKAVAVTKKAGSVLVAERGKGAWVSPIQNGTPFTPLSVSPAEDPTRARLVRSYEDSHTNTEEIDRLINTLGVQVEPIRMDSQAKYALVAAGAADLLLRFRSANRAYDSAKIWDHAAGALVVEEAGGCVTDLEGKPLDFSAGRTLARNHGVLASNGRLHPAALEGLRRMWGAVTRLTTDD
jgi:3'(2'), 5'-bisphosphate nucleotidase